MTPDQQREIIIKTAREWLNTPFKRGQCLPGKGVDCVQLLCTVANVAGINCGLPESYYGMSNGDYLLNKLSQYFRPINFPSAQSGDIACFRFAGVPHHVGLIAVAGERTTHWYNLIHASLTERKVVEHIFDDVYLRRLVAVFSVI